MAITAPDLVNPAGMATADDANSEAVGAGKKLTHKEWKNILRLYFTVRRSQVSGCGHKIDVERGPRNNCETCWFAWFNEHGELVQSIDELLHKPDGTQAVTALRGVKFVKNFRKFMATVAQWKTQLEKGKQCVH